MQNKSRLRKIALLTALSTSLLTGCGKKVENNTTTIVPTTTEITTEENTEEEVFNETINHIYNEYKEKSGKDIDVTDLAVKEYDNDTSYIHLNQDGKYVYNKDIRADDANYTWIEHPGKMYVVRVNKGTKEDPYYTPICALVEINGNVYNIEATLFDGSEKHLPDENYIEIENPDKNNINDLKNANEDIESGMTIISTEKNEYILLK